MNEQTDADLLRRAQRRAEGRAFFLAGALATFQELHEMDDEALAGFLGCPPEALPRLGLCRRPDPGAPDFRAAVEQIAAYAGITAFPLARLLRDVAATGALRAERPADAPSGGMLLAARDHRAPPSRPADGLPADEETAHGEPPAGGPSTAEER